MNKIINIIILLLLLPICVFSQSKFSTGVNINSQVSFLRITDSYASSGIGIEEKGRPGFGYSVGIQTQYELNENIFLRSGVNYQNRNHRHKIDGLKFGTDIGGTESNIQNDITISSIGIPVDFGYLIRSSNEKVNYQIGFGGILNVNVDTRTKAKAFISQIEEVELTEAENVVSESIYSLGVFGGIEIQLSNKLILGIEPNIRFTPDKFTLHLYNSEARNTIETGITLRIRMR